MKIPGHFSVQIYTQRDERETRALSKLLLRPAFALAQAFKVRPDQATHIHAALIGLAIRLSLSTIICIDESGDI